MCEIENVERIMLWTLLDKTYAVDLICEDNAFCAFETTNLEDAKMVCIRYANKYRVPITYDTEVE